MAFPLLAVNGDLGRTRIMASPSLGRRGRGLEGLWALALWNRGCVVLCGIVSLYCIVLFYYCFPMRRRSRRPNNLSGSARGIGTR